MDLIHETAIAIAAQTRLSGGLYLNLKGLIVDYR